MKAVIALGKDFTLAYGKRADLGAETARFRADFFQQFEKLAVGGGEGHASSIDHRKVLQKYLEVSFGACIVFLSMLF